MSDFPASSADVTIVVCCYSGEPFFEDTIKSVLAQDYRRYKLLVHDNGCSPSYQALIARVAAETGADVIRSEVNRYGEGLRADVLPHLRTRYVSILHDDDLFERDKLSRALAALRTDNLDFVFTDRLYVDVNNVPIAANYEEINTRPFLKSDYPYQFIADLFYLGLRFHFSTFVCTTTLAQVTALGDPFLPRIADSLFAARLLLDERFKGRSLDEKSTRVRVHGGNDMLYDKFAREDRGRELTLLSWSEHFIFADLLSRCTDLQLAELLRIFPGSLPDVYAGRAELLLSAGLKLAEWHRSKKLMAAACFHAAFELAPYQTMSGVRRLTSSDLNRTLTDTYQAYTRMEADIYRDFLQQDPHIVSVHEIELQQLRSQLFGALVASPEVERHPLLARFARLAASYDYGTEVSLAEPQNSHYVFGFSTSEPWGQWTDGEVAAIMLRPRDDRPPGALTLYVEHVWAELDQDAELQVAVNGRPLAPLRPRHGEALELRLDEATALEDGVMLVELRPGRTKMEKEAPTAELRRLGIGLRGFRLDIA